VRIFRVETRASASGPYGFYWEWAGWFDDSINNSHQDAQHPGPVADELFPSRGYGNWKFGMTTDVSLYQWFADWWPRLFEHGFVVSRYDIADQYVQIGRSQTQACFDISQEHERLVLT
jgi:hypothetical protein